MPWCAHLCRIEARCLLSVRARTDSTAYYEIVRRLFQTVLSSAATNKLLLSSPDEQVKSAEVLRCSYQP